MGDRSRTRKTAPPLLRAEVAAQFDVPQTFNCVRSVEVLGRGALLQVGGGPDERVSAIAALQRGRVARPQLLDAGLSRTMIEGRLTAGALRPRRRGVYAVGHDAPVELGAEVEALLAFGMRSMLARASAAVLWGILRRLTMPPGVELLVPGGCRRGRPGVRVQRSSTLLRRDVRVHRGLPVTSPARTVSDLAASGTFTEREVELALDEALRQGLTTVRELHDVADRHHGLPGAPRLEGLLARDSTATVTRSEAEEMLLEIVRAAGLPEPELNVRLHGYEVDALWRPQRVVVEVDGSRYHSSRRRFEEDRAKSAALTAHGLGVLRYTVRRMRHQPLAVAAELGATLARGA